MSFYDLLSRDEDNNKIVHKQVKKLLKKRFNKKGEFNLTDYKKRYKRVFNQTKKLIGV